MVLFKVLVGVSGVFFMRLFMILAVGTSFILAKRSPLVLTRITVLLQGLAAMFSKQGQGAHVSRPLRIDIIGKKRRKKRNQRAPRGQKKATATREERDRYK